MKKPCGYIKPMSHATPREERPFRKTRILVAPISSWDPLVPSFGSSPNISRHEEAEQLKSLNDWITFKEERDPAWLQRSRNLGPLLSALRFMAQGPCFTALHQILHRAYVEVIRRSLGDEATKEFSSPWTPDEVWLIFQGTEQLNSVFNYPLRATLTRRLIRSLLGPWVKVAPFRVENAECFVKCWELAALHIRPLLTGTPANAKHEARTRSTLRGPVVHGETDQWSSPTSFLGDSPDFRILFGTGTQAVRHSLLLLDSFTPSDGVARCWNAAVPGRPDDREGEMTGGAHPLVWECLGLPDLAKAHTAMAMEEQCQSLKAEIARLKQELAEERSSRLEREDIKAADKSRLSHEE